MQSFGTEFVLAVPDAHICYDLIVDCTFLLEGDMAVTCIGQGILLLIDFVKSLARGAVWISESVSCLPELVWVYRPTRHEMEKRLLTSGVLGDSLHPQRNLPWCDGERGSVRILVWLAFVSCCCSLWASSETKLLAFFIAVLFSVWQKSCSNFFLFFLHIHHLMILYVF